ncbi:MAG: hypothetical protein AAGD13_08955 [Pseudomonadota bacterium]
MALHLAARMHALLHGLFRPSDEAETRGLYDRVRGGLFARHGLLEPRAREQLIAELATEVLAVFKHIHSEPLSNG